MKLSTRTRYGVRALLELAENYGKGPLLMKTISERQEISKNYLENIFVPLRLCGLIKTVRGPGGGYILGRPPEEIRLNEVFNCLEGDSVIVECSLEEGGCKRFNECRTRYLWDEIGLAIESILAKYSLADLIVPSSPENPYTPG